MEELKSYLLEKECITLEEETEDQELAVNDSLHLELSEEEVESTMPPPGVTGDTLIIDETILFEECEDYGDEEDACE